MVKAYLRYVFNKAAGLVTGHSANIIYYDNMIISGNSQYVLILDIKTGEVVQILHENNKNSEVTSLAISVTNSNKQHNVILAAGFADGDVILWNWEDFSYKCNLNGHKSNVSHIQFNDDGTQLITGSGDTSIIVWDILGEQPLYKLAGHKNAITDLFYYKYQENEFTTHEFILSTSKDGLFKLWDMSISSSVQTISSLSNEVWNMTFYKKEKTILLGTNNDEIVVLKFAPSFDPVTNQKKFIEHVGNYKKQSFQRPIQMEFNQNQEYLFLMTNDKTVEIYKILSDEENKKKQKRKQKKLKKKEEKMEIEGGKELEEEDDGEEQVKETLFTERIQYHTTFHFQKKLRSFTFYNQIQKGKRNQNLFAVSYHNNNMELYEFQVNQNSYLEQKMNQDYNRLGHRQAIRAIAVSDNDALIASGGGESLKLWSSEDLQSIRTFETGHITAVRFLPRNRFFIAADKEGTIYLIDIPKSDIIQTIPNAHEASIWSIDYHESPHGYESIVIITGGADRKLKFWELILNSETKLLELQELKTLYMSEEVLCAKFAPNGYHYAATLLDQSIIINFSDSDKLFLTFYGHKLPVLSFDISSDNALLLSGSADKNVKLWGMDYGNCHKSIFAHQDAITCVKFVKDTHYFFSASKDRTVKYWDGDTYQLVMQFDECLGEVWTLAVSSVGDFFVTGSGDRLIRMWKQNKDQVFVQEEEEKRMEKMMIEDYTEEQLKREGEENHKQILQKQNMEVGEVIKKKFENLKYGEEIMAAIDQAEELRDQYVDYENQLVYYEKNKHILKELKQPEKPNLQTLFNLSIPEYVLFVIGKIKTIELENSLKFVHVSYIEKILYYLNFYVENNINTELASRILFFILKSHETHILNSKKLVKLLINIQQHLRQNISKERDTIGMNLCGIQMIQNDLKSRKTDDIFSDDIFSKRSTLF
ncbi:hypothetical protein ABPG72_017591 [Tetrahymena utriculariae]